MSVKTANRSMLQSASSYTFTTTPRTIVSNKANRRKYREPNETGMSAPVNMMYDPRIRRGSTVVSQLKQQQEQEQEEEEEKRKAEILRKHRDQLKIKQQLEEQKPDTPEPVEGRQHMEIQTEQYLEEISDRPVEKEVDTQTDPIADRPPSPLFIPAKSGEDKATQIDPELVFNFDLEVENILSLLVAKTLEQSLMEVREEEEVASMKKHQEEFAAQRAAELAKTQQMEAEERRKEEEKERRLKQEHLRLEREKKQKEKASAREYAAKYLKEMTNNVFSTLTEQGFFHDPVQREIEVIFLPWLLDQTEKQLSQRKVANKVVDELLKTALAKAKEKHNEAKKIAAVENEKKQKLLEEQRQLEAKREEEAERKAKEASEKANKDEDEQEEPSTTEEDE